MPVVQACPVTVTGAIRRVLTRRSRGQKTPYRDKVRAQIVLLAARRWSNTAIAAQVGITVDTVRTWRGRFAEQGLAGLADRARSGRPSRFTPVQVAQVKALACQFPARAGVALSRWSCPELAREVVGQGIAEAMSASTVWRWLAREAIKPWQYRSWLFPRDPDFATKAERVLDLYERRWAGRKLGPREYVISSDEKTSIQARCRCHPALAPGQARMMRVNHEYERGGAVAYLAAYDVARARVFGRCAASTGIVPFMALVEQVMTVEPYASAKRVFWVVDNGSSHRGQAAIDRLAKRFPNAVMVHTPVHPWPAIALGSDPDDFDHDWRPVEHASVELVKAMAASDIGFGARGDEIWNILLSEAQNRDEPSGTSGEQFDALTSAINRPCTKALETVLSFLGHEYRLNGTVMPEALELLSSILQLDGRIGVEHRAILATRIEFLRHIAPAWFEQHHGELFGGDSPSELGQVTVDLAVRWGQVNKWLLDSYPSSVRDAVEHALEHYLVSLRD
ncbi:IS630 family transposase [Amycolatopsis sp. NPDC051371]|uniref:IS630 family transposase n=1 Tax=Amycolatopsis sp. NPDC051371 TaxID=3155800 RepID=UPI00341AB557